MDAPERKSDQHDVSADERRLQSTEMTGAHDSPVRPPDHSVARNEPPSDLNPPKEKTGNLADAALSTREQRLAFLVAIGDLLSSSLSYEKALQHLADLVVPQVADWCVVDIADERGILERLAVAHIDPKKLRLASELHECYPPLQGRQGAYAVFRSGEPQWTRSIPDEWLFGATTDEGQLAVLRELGLRSYVSVPLSARGAVLGVLTLITTESGRVYDQEDFTFAQAIASRAAMAIDNARLFEAAQHELRERRQAEQYAAAREDDARQRLDELQALMDLVPVGIAMARDSTGRNISINAEAAALLGIDHTRDAFEGQKLPFRILRDGQEAQPGERLMQRALACGASIRNEELDVVRDDGSTLTLLESTMPLRDGTGGVRGCVGVFTDITERRASERLLEVRARQLEAIAAIVQLGLSGKSLQMLLDTAAQRVSGALGAGLCAVLELQPDRTTLLLQSGIGWEEGLVGAATLSADRGTQAGYTLVTDARSPVTVEDIPRDERFQGNALLEQHGVVSSASVRISADGDQPYGVLAVYERRPRRFSEEECRFLQSAADALANLLRGRRAAAMAKDSLDQLHFTLGAADLGTWEWNMDTGEVTWTEGLMRIHGRKPGRFKGTIDSALDDVHPQDREYLMGAIAATLETDMPYHVEYRIITSDEKVRWVEARGRVVREAGGRPRKFHGICMDTTERKRHYEVNALLASIVESSDDAIISKTLDGIIQSWNGAAQRLFGYTEEQAVGRHITLIIPVDRADEEDQIIARLRAGERIDHFDTVRLRRDGHLIHVSLTISPIKDEAGRIVGASKIVRDITKRMQIEQALRESEQHLRTLSETLERQVEARTAELQRQAARLRHLAGKLISAEQRERKHLAAILHDGLQQLLVAAKIRLSQMRNEVSDSAARTAMEGVINLLDQAVDSSRNLTRQLRPPVLYEDGLIPALCWFASEISKLHDLHVAIDTEGTEPPLSDDIKILLFESVRELLFNVAKHAGVKEATVRVRQDGQRLRIAVEDKGGGFNVMAAGWEENLQQPGMGLFSIRERLAALSGDIAIESSPGKGTRIRLTIPLPQAVSEQATGQTERLSLAAVHPSSCAATAARQARIVVVDDHAIVREGISNVLRADTRLVVVGEAADGVEAIEVVERHQPDVVLIDVNMPRMNGVEATREIRRRWPKVRIVALSVQDDAATARTMIQAGAAAFISKSDEAGHMIKAVLPTEHEG